MTIVRLSCDGIANSKFRKSIAKKMDMCENLLEAMRPAMKDRMTTVIQTKKLVCVLLTYG